LSLLEVFFERLETIVVRKVCENGYINNFDGKVSLCSLTEKRLD
jgi:hypothetical protein